MCASIPDGFADSTPPAQEIRHLHKRCGMKRDHMGQTGIADQRGLGRTRADAETIGSRKGQTFMA
jgi:hypothetical protein